MKLAKILEYLVVGRLNALCRETGEYGVPTQNRMLKNRQSRLEFGKRFFLFYPKGKFENRRFSKRVEVNALFLS